MKLLKNLFPKPFAPNFQNVPVCPRLYNTVEGLRILATPTTWIASTQHNLSRRFESHQPRLIEILRLLFHFDEACGIVDCTEYKLKTSFRRVFSPRLVAIYNLSVHCEKCLRVRFSCKYSFANIKRLSVWLIVSDNTYFCWIEENSFDEY